MPPDANAAGTPTRIPRPPDARPGRPAPWDDLSARERRGIGLTRLGDALDGAGRRLGYSTPPEPLDELSGVAPETTAGLVDAAVLVAAFERDGEARVVLTRRAGHLRRHRGEIALPGGRREPGEEPLAAAVREAHEEVDLDPGSVRPIAWLSPLVTFASGSLIRPFVATVDAEPALRADPSEVERVFDVALAELLEEGVFHEERWRRTTPRPGADEDGSFPIFFYEVSGEVIWGATARILTELLSIVVGVAAS